MRDVQNGPPAMKTPKTKYLIDDAGILDWDAEGYIAFTRGPFEGDRLVDMTHTRLKALARSRSLPASTRKVLDDCSKEPKQPKQTKTNRVYGAAK